MGSEPWLSAEQQRVWRTYLAMNSALNARIEADIQREAGMPMAYYLVLAMLSEAPDRTLRMRQLALVAQMSQSRLSHAVARLEEAGWVRRVPAPNDGRGQLAILTDAGYDRLEQAAPSHAETVRTMMFDPMTDDQAAAFGEACRVVLDNIGRI